MSSSQSLGEPSQSEISPRKKLFYHGNITERGCKLSLKYYSEYTGDMYAVSLATTIHNSVFVFVYAKVAN